MTTEQKTGTHTSEQPTMKTGTQLIEEERLRQIAKEGWSLEHDDSHQEQELMRMAMCYLDFEGGDSRNSALMSWPLPEDELAFKPDRNDTVRNLVKAGALIAAEIDRINRIGSNEAKVAAILNRTASQEERSVS